MDDPIVIGAEPIQVTAAQAQANRQWMYQLGMWSKSIAAVPVTLMKGSR